MATPTIVWAARWKTVSTSCSASARSSSGASHTSPCTTLTSRSVSSRTSAKALAAFSLEHGGGERERERERERRAPRRWSWRPSGWSTWCTATCAMRRCSSARSPSTTTRLPPGRPTMVDVAGVAGLHVRDQCPRHLDHARGSPAGPTWRVRSSPFVDKAYGAHDELPYRDLRPLAPRIRMTCERHGHDGPLVLAGLQLPSR